MDGWIGGWKGGWIYRWLVESGGVVEGTVVHCYFLKLFFMTTVVTG